MSSFLSCCRADFLEDDERVGRNISPVTPRTTTKTRRRKHKKKKMRDFSDTKVSISTVVKTLSLRSAAKGKKKQQPQQQQQQQQQKQQTIEDVEKSLTGQKISAQVFTFRQMAAATNNFSIENLVGEGGFGRVYKGYIPGVDKLVAIKQLDKNGLQGNREFLSEVFMLSLVDHPNLVNLIGYCADGDQRILVYEYMANGSLEDHLLDLPPNKEPLDWHTRMKIAEGAAKGLEYLHETINPPVIYRDFKASNILLDEEFNPKLSDFGLARIGPTGEEDHVSTRVMGTYGYCAPEYAMTGQLTTKSDVYSFGVVFLELISGRRAIDTTKQTAEQNLVSWAQPFFKDRKLYAEMADPLLGNKFPEKALNQALAVASMCLQEEASTRPLISDVVTALEFLAKPTNSEERPQFSIFEADNDHDNDNNNNNEDTDKEKPGYVSSLESTTEHMM